MDRGLHLWHLSASHFQLRLWHLLHDIEVEIEIWDLLDHDPPRHDIRGSNRWLLHHHLEALRFERSLLHGFICSPCERLCPRYHLLLPEHGLLDELIESVLHGHPLHLYVRVLQVKLDLRLLHGPSRSDLHLHHPLPDLRHWPCGGGEDILWVHDLNVRSKSLLDHLPLHDLWDPQPRDGYPRQRRSNALAGQI